MAIVTEHQRFGRRYTAVNGMSVTGVNSHVLLHGHYKPKVCIIFSCIVFVYTNSSMCIWCGYEWSTDVWISKNPDCL